MPINRPIPLLLSLSLLVACTGDDTTTTEPTTGTETQQAVPPAAPAEALAPLPEGSLRVDGVYRARLGGVGYVMRFYPEGFVMNTAGMAKEADGLKDLLVPSTPTGGNSAVHRSAVRVQGDSVLFTTRGMKGEIDYQGLRLGTDSIRFRKYSHINGRDVTLTYFFEPDGSSAQ